MLTFYQCVCVYIYICIYIYIYISYIHDFSIDHICIYIYMIFFPVQCLRVNSTQNTPLCLLFRTSGWDFPGGPGYNSALLIQGAQVQFLVTEQ